MGKLQKPLKRRLSVHEPVKTPASDEEVSQDPEEEVVLLLPFFHLNPFFFGTLQDLLQNGVQEDDSSDSEADIEESDNEDNESAEEQSEEDADDVPGDSSEEGLFRWASGKLFFFNFGDFQKTQKKKVTLNLKTAQKMKKVKQTVTDQKVLQRFRRLMKWNIQ